MASLIFDVALALLSIAVATGPAIYLNRRMLAKFPGRRPFAWGYFLTFVMMLIGILSLLMAFSYTEEQGTLIVAGIVSCLLSIMMYRRNRWAWLIAVILQANPLAWIVNGIYLKNRWAEMRDEK